MSGIGSTTGTPLLLGSLPGQALRESHPPELLAAWLEDARQRTLTFLQDLDSEQLRGPRQGNVSPLLWELGHLAWFTEKWALRRQGQDSLRPDADTLYDAATIPPARRRELPLPTREQTLAYFQEVHERILDRLDGVGSFGLNDTYVVLLVLFYQDMHGEALASTRQALAYPAPLLGDAAAGDGFTPHRGRLPGDVVIPGGRFLLGALPGEPFVLDNEKWAYPVDVRPFAMARAPVTQGEFAAFVDGGGYWRREFWSENGWLWRESAGTRHPVYWSREGPSWFRRHFDRLVPLEPDLPMHHVCWYEAEAFCRWGRRRLPAEVEWEIAAASWPTGERPALSMHKRRFPWGDEPPAASQANLDGRLGGCIDVAACPDGDSAWGCRQLLGNVWEWTATDFHPYPGFAVDPYQDYSRPWFGSHKVLRGGCWLTRSRVLRNTFRNFLRPDRRDLWAGFRTCALDA